MVSTGVYDNSTPPTRRRSRTTSSIDVLRGQLGFQGAVMTDDLQRPTGHSTSESAVLAALAGADIVLACSDSAGGGLAYSGLLQAAQSGQIPRATIETAYTRVRALKRQYATG